MAPDFDGLVTRRCRIHHNSVPLQVLFLRDISVGKRLLPTDPAHYSLALEPGGGPCTRRSLQLPSARWQWEDEWYVQETLRGELTDKGGWQYANDFGKPFGCQRFINSFVRRRRWVRWRRFTAENRWLLVASPHNDPLEDPLQDVAVGGELIPHRPDGALCVWAVTVGGQLLARLGVERLCLEGTCWQSVPAPTLNASAEGDQQLQVRLCDHIKSWKKLPLCSYHLEL